MIKRLVQEEDIFQSFTVRLDRLKIMICPL